MSGLLEMLGLSGGTRGKHKRRLMTAADRKQMAARPPSFTELLPWVKFSPKDRNFVMRDGKTLGALFELGAVATEAQPLEYLQEHCRKIQEAIQAIPEVDSSPWVVQFFLSDDRNIDGLNQYLHDYILSQHKDAKRAQAIIESEYTQSVLKEFRSHLSQVSREQGLFTDTLVTGQTWRGQQRRVRCCIYRQFDDLVNERRLAEQQMEAVATTLLATLNEAGVTARRANGKDFYEWMLPFFNRNVPWASTGAELFRGAPYPGDEAPEGIYDWDFSESLNLSEPSCNQEQGCFEFDGQPVKFLTLQNLRAHPSIGHFSAESRIGNEAYARFDRLPPGSMLSVTVTIAAQYQVERHVEDIKRASRAQNAVAQETHRESEQVLQHMATGDKLYPMFMGLYLSGKTHADLDAAVSEVNAQLTPTGMRFIESREDLVPHDAFLRALPFAFDPTFDLRSMRRSRLTFASLIAAILPVYGRSRGTANPGFWFWNRGGEPLWIDPLNKIDRKKNAHMVVFGPTGAGKSATLNYLSMLVMAIHRPRLVIADAGKSFDLMVKDMATKGLSVHRVNLSGDTDVSLPPFVYASELLQDKEIMESFKAAEEYFGAGAGIPSEEDAELVGAERLMESVNEVMEPADADDDSDEEKRDYLGEMLISAIMMITGGEDAELKRMTRADRYLVTRAIIRAAVRVSTEGKRHPLTQDVALELTAMVKDASLSEHRRSRAEEMGHSMMSFTTGLRGKLFNRLGQDWPDADVTLVEMGTLTKDGYEDALAVAYTSLLDSVQSRAEAAQHEDRPLIMLTDEGHLITTNELLGPKVAKGTKMWRKLNAWFWLATQNLKDFPGSMSRVLSMCEFWMLLTMDKNEIEEIARFRSLTPEQRHMMESAVKEPAKYTEGVLISANNQWLFRNVPPALPIALAMTEGHEKAERRRLMDEHGCTEVQAAYRVAARLQEARA
ncbi:conjugative transfer ATPase [Comamonas sp. E6]|uniref:conjugative transfer ATPase n=1 Tax=Comamonas sp. E6 TaxID=364029 RepID=UPI0006300E7E|nr:conjugative transfer ATPase [Comamonas sp. E6]GAO72866.1 hypothetical protein CSE6_027_43030 [Comamonas sp. E6]